MDSTVLMNRIRRNEYTALFDIPHYQVFKKYFTFIGQGPQHTERLRRTITSVEVLLMLLFWMPAVVQFVQRLRIGDLDEAFLILSPIVTASASLIKITNLNVNKKKFREIFDLIEDEWRLLQGTSEFDVLDKVTKHGSILSSLYARTLLVCLLLFTMLPLLPFALDVIVPLNETRKRQMFVEMDCVSNADEYFYQIYVVQTLIATVVVLTIVTVDCLYMTVSHHACAMFAVCAHCVEKATGIGNGTVWNIDVKKQLKMSVMIHNKAIKFSKLVNDSMGTSLLFLVALNVIDISVTAVQMVMYLNQPAELLRTFLFFECQQFHLFVNSLPGQKLTDHSLQLMDDIYAAKWYRLSPEMQRIVYLMQMRSAIPVVFSAGGFYVLNIENFGVVFKTSMSYCTLLLSFRDT